MYIHIIECIYVYVHTTYIYQYACTCTYMDIRVHKFMNMYVHFCTMFRHVYTVLPYPVQGGRIPDDWYRKSIMIFKLVQTGTYRSTACQ